MINKDTFFYLYGLSCIGKSTFSESLACKDITGLPNCRESLYYTDYEETTNSDHSSWSAEVYNTWNSPVGIRGAGNAFSNIIYIPGEYQDMRTPSVYFEEHCMKHIKHHKNNVGKIEVLVLVTSEEILINRIFKGRENKRCVVNWTDEPVSLLEEYIKIVKLLENGNISYTLIDNSWGKWFKKPAWPRHRAGLKVRIIQPDEIESVVTKWTL